MTEEITDSSKKKRKILTWIFLIVSFCILAAGLVVWLVLNKDFKRTSDAYVEGNSLVITPLRGGFVTAILTDDTYLVKEGQLLVTLDTTDAKIALNEAKENYANVIREVCQTYHQAFSFQSEIRIRKAELIKAEEFYNHRYDVLDEGAISLEDFQAATAILESTYYAYKQTTSLYQKANSLIRGKSIQNNPRVLAAADRLVQAWVDLYRCKIYSPVEGLVAQRTTQLGMWVKEGEPLLSVIPLNQIWVNTNFKETQMKRMKIGQKVKLHADMYGREILYHGTIVGLPGGAGNAFSILPPQNLSGNWIKIVQRLPVRVDINKEDLKQYPLRIGMTMHATVDVKGEKGTFLPTSNHLSPQYTTNIYQKETQGSKELLEQIFLENLDPTLSNYAYTPYNPELTEESE